MNIGQQLRRTRPVPEIGQVHLGPGAFFKAFNAVYTEDVLRQLGGAWGIAAVSLRSAKTRDQLQENNNTYAAITLDPDAVSVACIESIARVLVAPENPKDVIDQMADPQVRIVSLTITEKGYCHTPNSGQLDLMHPDIQHDLENPGAPRSAIGFIVEALRLRRARKLAPFTVLSCDNLPENGQLTRNVILSFAHARAPELADWIARNGRFPCCMVDRITPATQQEDVDRLHQKTGINDPGCVVHEPFRQWVIEDDFADGRPEWDMVGAQFVHDVRPHEMMKLRCLNGTHSTLAYLGFLAGYDTIANVAGNTAFATLCKQLWRNEILPTVPTPQGENLESYCEALLERYQNPSIQHRLAQIAMDGSQKLPQRILDPIRDNLRSGGKLDGLCLAVAGWLQYASGIDEAGNSIDVRDPLRSEIQKAASSAATTEQTVEHFLKIAPIFGSDLPKEDRFRGTLVAQLSELKANGAQAAVESYLRASSENGDLGVKLNAAY